MLLLQREEDKEENYLSEEAERSFNSRRSVKDEDEPVATDRPQVSDARPDVTYRNDDDSRAQPPTTIRVPVIVTAT